MGASPQQGPETHLLKYTLTTLLPLIHLSLRLSFPLTLFFSTQWRKHTILGGIKLALPFKKKKKQKNEICCSLFMVEITPPLFPPAICFHPPIHLHEELTYRTDYSVNVLLLLITQRLLSGNKPGHCF